MSPIISVLRQQTLASKPAKTLCGAHNTGKKEKESARVQIESILVLFAMLPSSRCFIADAERQRAQHGVPSFAQFQQQPFKTRK